MRVDPKSLDGSVKCSIQQPVRASVENLVVCDQIRPDSPIETLLMHAVMGDGMVYLDILWAEMNGIAVATQSRPINLSEKPLS